MVFVLASVLLVGAKERGCQMIKVEMPSLRQGITSFLQEANESEKDT